MRIKRHAYRRRRSVAQHVNFIVNKGDATAEDIENLMSKVRDNVREKTGVTLRPEVRVVGKRKSHV